MEPVGTQITLWAIRFSCGLYVVSYAAWLTGRPTAGRFSWTVAYILYLIHVCAAFTFYHHWSHSSAYGETARQTANLFGIHWGGGVYFNYVFTVVWGVDVWRLWSGRKYGRKWIGVVIQAFLAFMFLNGAVVFASGWIRWLGVTAMIGLGLLWLKHWPFRDIQVGRLR